LKIDDIHAVIERVLYEFPVQEIRVNYPKWIETLPIEHWLKQSFISTVKQMVANVGKLREMRGHIPALEENDYVKKAHLEKIALGEGTVHIELNVDESLFYRILSETTGMDISGEYQLISTIKVLAEAKKEFDKIKFALEEVRRKGYGIVTPATDEMKLEPPVIVKHGSKYGVKIRASAPSIHLQRIKQKCVFRAREGSEKQAIYAGLQCGCKFDGGVNKRTTCEKNRRWFFCGLNFARVF
jgi:stage IV sporulation protein A